MKRKIKIILTSHNINNNPKGSIIKVSKGYAFNYLIPKKNAEIGTKKKVKHITMFENIQKKKQEINERRTKEITEKIKKISKISLYKKTGENDLIFGSVTEKDILKWISVHTNLKINKEQIKLLDIKAVGKINAKIQLKQNLSENIQINILPANI
uniref:50S ribosomal protein L9, chloroplastic n=1 Tax=Vertebrata lanosa TaxID=1261582 RepID=A0A0B5VQJ8_9FLOR|nr:50S ribosomal protein L9 [Vertebrata lanosa]AJH65887.1 50S ribosomal protein L9 [Vertebrata lanosa]